MSTDINDKYNQVLRCHAVAVSSRTRSRDFDDEDPTPIERPESLRQAYEEWLRERDLRALEEVIPTSERPTRNMRPLKKADL